MKCKFCDANTDTLVMGDREYYVCICCLRVSTEEKHPHIFDNMHSDADAFKQRQNDETI